MARELKIAQPFDLKLSLTMGQAFRWRHLGDGWYSGVVGEHLIHIRQTGGVNGPVEYRVGGPDGERPASHKDDEMLLRYFREDDDVQAIYDDISSDPVVKDLVRRYSGMRVLRQESWECLVSYICSRSNGIGNISASVETIAKLSEKTVSICDDERHLFPTAEELLAIGETRLRALQLKGISHGGPAIFDVAIRVACLDLDLSVLKQAYRSYSEVINDLKRTKGIGYKIANCVALMALDRLEAFPADTWVMRATRTWYDDFPMPANPRHVASKRENDTIVQWTSRKFGGYAGYAGQYLFQGIEPHKNQVRRDGSCPCCEAEARAAGLLYKGPVWKLNN